MLVSSNGIVWEAVASGVTNDLSGIAFADGQFLAVGTAGLVLRSTDLASWPGQSSPTTNRLNGISRCGGLFVATGNAGTLLTSPDGITWTAQNTGTTRDMVGATFGNNEVLAVGQGSSNPGMLLSSSDLIHWVNRSALNRGVAFYSAAFGNGVFVAMDARGIAYITANWTNYISHGTVNSDYVSGVVFAQNTFLGVGGPFSGGSQKVVTSSDGINWKQRPVSVTNSAALRAVAYGNGYFIAVGDKGLIVQSGPISTLRLQGAAGGTASLLLDGEMGRGYRLQACSDLSASNWSDVLSVTNTTEVMPVLDAGAGPQVRLYRVVSP
jgi:hypothetical protein